MAVILASDPGSWIAIADSAVTFAWEYTGSREMTCGVPV